MVMFTIGLKVIDQKEKENKYLSTFSCLLQMNNNVKNTQ